MSAVGTGGCSSLTIDHPLRLYPVKTNGLGIFNEVMCVVRPGVMWIGSHAPKGDVEAVPVSLCDESFEVPSLTVEGWGLVIVCDY